MLFSNRFSTCEAIVTGSSMYIISLYTIKSHRGKGYGTKLLKSVINYASNQGLKYIFLDDMGNSSSPSSATKTRGNIYAKFGFQVRKANRFGREVWSTWKEDTNFIGPERRLVL